MTTLDEKVKQFQALRTHAEKCVFFHANPELARIFGAHHFPKPEAKQGGATVAPPAPEVKTTDSH